MVFGYTILDPIIVLIGTVFAVWCLARRPTRLIPYMPAALSVYFFVPTVTLLTLWQTVPLLLFARLWVARRVVVADEAKPVIGLLATLFIASMCFALIFGLDSERAVVRSMYYFGAFAVFLFCYEMARRDGAYELFLKGMAITASAFAVYAVYQIIALQFGLPVRGIVRSVHGAQLAYEGGILRVNSFASEPKRLGYVLFVGAIACRAIAVRLSGSKRMAHNFLAVFCSFVSLLTFSGSYLLSVFLFVSVAVLLYPKRSIQFLLPATIVVVVFAVLQPENVLFSTIEKGIERRSHEVEVGLDGAKVYRQEFFANDYLLKNPLVAVTGAGVGQYYTVLNQNYGTGVGIGAGGSLLPMNSTFLELTFDVGGPFAVLFYGSLVMLILKLRKQQQHFLALSLLFLVIQSLTISTFLYICMFAGISLAECRRKAAETASRAFRVETSVRPGLNSGRAHGT